MVCCCGERPIPPSFGVEKNFLWRVSMMFDFIRWHLAWITSVDGFLSFCSVENMKATFFGCSQTTMKENKRMIIRITKTHARIT